MQPPAPQGETVGARRTGALGPRATRQAVCVRLGLPSWRGGCVFLVGEWVLGGDGTSGCALLAAANRRSALATNARSLSRAQANNGFYDGCVTRPPNVSTLHHATSARRRRCPSPPAAPAATNLTSRQREILELIDRYMRERGYPPSVREIGEAVGLTSPSTVHNHLASLQRRGLLRRDPTKPRAIEVR